VHVTSLTGPYPRHSKSYTFVDLEAMANRLQRSVRISRPWIWTLNLPHTRYVRYTFL